MKQQPIIMCAFSVRALQAGQKWQTRRIVQLPLVPEVYDGAGPDGWEVITIGGRGTTDSRGQQLPEQPALWHQRDGVVVAHPHSVGDRLWVKENCWGRPERTPKMMREGADTWPSFLYDAEGADAAELKAQGWKRHTSMLMPRAASRLTLEVAAVRFERLHSISEADCIAEGCRGGHGAIPGYAYSATPREHYQRLFAKVNGRNAWAGDPWVRVTEFVRQPSA